jgi:hypothetical protein
MGRCSCSKPADGQAFDQIRPEVFERGPLHSLACTLIPARRYWHFVVWFKPGQDGEVTCLFLQRSVRHSLRLHAHRNTLGMVTSIRTGLRHFRSSKMHAFRCVLKDR